MQMMKKENGITIIALVITVILMLIIAGISIDVGLDSVDSTKDRKLQAELQMVGQETITEYAKARKLGYIKEDNSIPDNFIGVPITEQSSLPSTINWELTVSQAVGYKSYFVLTPDLLEKLQILNSEHTYIINYYTGEVYNQTKKTASTGSPLYIKLNNLENNLEKEQDTTSFVN